MRRRIQRVGVGSDADDERPAVPRPRVPPRGRRAEKDERKRNHHGKRAYEPHPVHLNRALATVMAPLEVSCTPVRFVLKAANVTPL